MDATDLADDFATFVARLDPTMAIVTACHDGQRSGCLIGFHSQCSIDPPLHAVWLSKANHTHGIALQATHLAVHVVDRSSHDLADLFGGTTGDDIDKFAEVACSSGAGGAPLLDRLGTRFVGRRVDTIDVDGDHTCVVLEPVAVDLAAEPGRGYVTLADAVDIDPGHEADD